MKKKTYTKPEIMFEDFTMSTNIAADCDVRNSLPSIDQCPHLYKISGIRDEETYIFTDDVQTCTTKESDGEYDGICYHNPFGTSFFNSL